MSDIQDMELAFEHAFPDKNPLILYRVVVKKKKKTRELQLRNWFASVEDAMEYLKDKEGTIVKYVSEM